MHPPRVAAVAVAGLALALASPPTPASAATFTYTVETRGPVTSDVAVFADVAATTLADPRGWSLDGAVRFERAAPGSFQLILATPAEVAAAAPVCSETYSCRVGDQVLINEERWNTGTASWTGSLESYRSYVINHEVGHWLGLDHWECPGSGQAAPVMQQQSISLDGCVANTWPVAAEKRAVADIHGVDWSGGVSHPFAEEIDWLLDNGISTGYPDGRFHGGRPVTREAMATFIYRLVHDGQDPPGCSSEPFPDVGVDNQFCGAIAWMAEEGITQGYADGTFRPTAGIARDAMAAFFHRLFADAAEPPSCTDAPFADVGPQHPFCGEIRWMRETGISTGWPDGTYRPAAHVSREAMAAFMHRAVVEQGLTAG